MRPFAVVLAMGVSAVARAQPVAPAAGLPHGSGYYLVQALVSLALVVALIYGATWLLRRLGPGRPGAGAAGPAEVLQSLPLSGGYTLHIVRMGERTLAVTCGPGGVAVTDTALPPTDEGEEAAP